MVVEDGVFCRLQSPHHYHCFDTLDRQCHTSAFSQLVASVGLLDLASILIRGLARQQLASPKQWRVLLAAPTFLAD